MSSSKKSDSEPSQEKQPAQHISLDLVCDELLPQSHSVRQTAGASNGTPGQPSERPFIGVKFKCCHVYSRIYIAPDCQAYRGSCPKCGKRITFEIGAGGTKQRFFEAQ